MRAGVVFLAVFLGFASPVARAAVTVPFVGCAAASDAKVPVHAMPDVGLSFALEPPVALNIPRQIAAKLAVYGDGEFLKVLAPRGWACSSANGRVPSLSVYPVGTSHTTSGPAASITVMGGGTGPAIDFVVAYGGRYFPDIVPEGDVLELLRDSNLNETEEQFLAPSFSDDTLNYVSKSELEFITPAGKQGLGSTMGPGLSKTLSTYGLLQLAYPPHDSDAESMTVFLLRLPPEDAALRQYILDFMK